MRILIIIILGGTMTANAQRRIIDMHLHSYTQSSFSKPMIDFYGNKGAVNATEHFAETFQAMVQFNIIKAVVSGSLESVEEWKAKDSGNRIIRGIMINDPKTDGIDSIELERLIKEGKVQVFGELGPYYAGITLSDPIWRPYLSLCEKYDIPVAVHTGGGDPGGTYSYAPKARLPLGDPYLVEDMLVAFPKLRIYIMHSGEDWYEHALRLMAYYPQLYSDLGALLWVEPMDQRYAVEFLRRAKEAGYLNRVMFGTDQMHWPYAIEKSIRFLDGLDFLSEKDKEDIFYNNAARFLRL